MLEQLEWNVDHEYKEKYVIIAQDQKEQQAIQQFLGENGITPQTYPDIDITILPENALPAYNALLDQRPWLNKERSNYEGYYGETFSVISGNRIQPDMIALRAAIAEVKQRIDKRCMFTMAIKDEIKAINRKIHYALGDLDASFYPQGFYSAIPQGATENGYQISFDEIIISVVQDKDSRTVFTKGSIWPMGRKEPIDSVIVQYDLVRANDKVSITCTVYNADSTDTLTPQKILAIETIQHTLSPEVLASNQRDVVIKIAQKKFPHDVGEIMQTYDRIMRAIPERYASYEDGYVDGYVLDPLRAAESMNEFRLFVELGQQLLNVDKVYDFNREKPGFHIIEWARLRTHSFDEFAAICRNIIAQKINRNFGYDLYAGHEYMPFVDIKDLVFEVYGDKEGNLSVLPAESMAVLNIYRKLARKIMQDNSLNNVLGHQNDLSDAWQLGEVHQCIVQGIRDEGEKKQATMTLETYLTTLLNDANEYTQLITGAIHSFKHQRDVQQAIGDFTQSIQNELQQFLRSYRYISWRTIGLDNSDFDLSQIIESVMLRGGEDIRLSRSQTIDDKHVQIRLITTYSSYDELTFNIMVAPVLSQDDNQIIYDYAHPIDTFTHTVTIPPIILNHTGSLHLANVFIFEGAEILDDTNDQWRQLMNTVREHNRELFTDNYKKMFFIIARSGQQQTDLEAYLKKIHIPLDADVRIVLLEGQALQEYDKTKELKPWVSSTPAIYRDSIFRSNFSVIQGNTIPQSCTAFREAISDV